MTDSIDESRKREQQHRNESIAAVKDQLSTLSYEDSLEECEDCGDLIPEARREACPGVTMCTSCADWWERRNYRAN